MKKMTKPFIQIDHEVREMNDTEFGKYQEMLIQAKAKETETQAKAEAKSALLDRLGITADEAALLLQ
jgi:hypothetical protein